MTGYYWRKSSHSFSNGNCVEVGHAGPAVAVRDSKDPGGPVLACTASAWQEFAAQVRV